MKAPELSIMLDKNTPLPVDLDLVTAYPVEEKKRESFMLCVYNTLHEFDRISLDARKRLLETIKLSENNVKTILDAQNATRRILEELQTLIKGIDLLKEKHSDGHKVWLEECLGVRSHIDDSIIDLGDSSSSSDEPEIVNEVKYLKTNESVRKDSGYDAQKDKWLSKFTSTPSSSAEFNGLSAEGETSPLPSKTRRQGQKPLEGDLNPPVINIDSCSSMTQQCQDHITKADECSSTIHRLHGEKLLEDQNCMRDDDRKSHHSDQDLRDKSESVSEDLDSAEARTITLSPELDEFCAKIDRSHLLDEKIRMKCVVQLKKCDSITDYLQMEILDKNENLCDKVIDRAIDLSALELKKRKRLNTSSDDSNTASNSSPSQIRRKQDRKYKKSKTKPASNQNENYNSSSECTSTDFEFPQDDTDSSISKFGEKMSDDEEEESKRKLLESASSDESLSNESSGESEGISQNLSTKRKKKKKVRRINSSDSLETSEDEEDQYYKKKFMDPILMTNFGKLLKDKPKKTDGDAKDTETESSSADQELGQNKVEKKKKRKRRKIPKLDSSESDTKGYESSQSDCIPLESDQDLELIEEIPEAPDSCILVDPCPSIQVTPVKSAGRRNIRPVWRDEQIEESSKRALKEEENRRQRVAERNEEMQLVSIERSASEEVLVLELDKDTKEIKLSVDKGLVKNLKPHQKSGVKFMWESCFESIERSKTTEGSGCILAHCMGLGKTFQTITLVHTLLTNEAVGIQNVLVVCPMNTLLNWADEFEIWMRKVESGKKVQVHEITKIKELPKRIEKMQQWHEKGGVMIISYEMYRSLMTRDLKLSPEQIEKMRGFLSNPGADLIICDEGHLLKNEVTQLAQKMQEVKTRRRIVLTGTPLQNNLNEYHCMVNFVKPNLLGTKKEFHNRFVNPITNGQYDNSNSSDVTLMKRRAHVLHRLLEGCVQRCDYSVLTPFLPPKQEYVIHIRLSDLQKEMYSHFMTCYVRVDTMKKQFFENYNAIKLLFAHPWSIQLKEEAKALSQAKSNSQKSVAHNTQNELWWSKFTNRQDFQDIMVSFKLILCFGILEAAELEGDKILIFSHSLHSLQLIEKFLEKFDNEISKGGSQNLFKFSKGWKKNRDYYVLDGTTTSDQRNRLCRKFNDPTNTSGRLFLISTKAGGLGINLIGANRVIIFDPSWNPSHDVQSIFRIYRFGQKKPCYVYRLLSAGTMEQKIYQRGVNKLALSHRVIDEQQISRHFRDTDLAELYKLEDLDDEPGINVPADRLLADVLYKHKNYVYKISEHDTLLENKEEEELNEEERQEAWNEYEQEKRNATAAAKPNPKDLLKRIANGDLTNGENEIAALTSEDIPQMSSTMNTAPITFIRASDLDSAITRSSSTSSSSSIESSIASRNSSSSDSSASSNKSLSSIAFGNLLDEVDPLPLDQTL